MLDVQGNPGCNAPPGSHPGAGRFGALYDAMSFGTVAVAPPSPCGDALSRLVCDSESGMLMTLLIIAHNGLSGCRKQMLGERVRESVLLI